MSGNSKTVVIAMSGGVDSSVAAALLKEQGYNCIGVFMRLGNDPADQAQNPSNTPVEPVACSPTKAAKAHHQGCCSTADAADARYVAGLLNIPFYALNFQNDFSGIIDYFVSEYNRGRTPNPCVRCNENLKFGKLARYARAVGADFVATGHYARIERTADGQTRLLRGVDKAKDQSYVLFGVPPDELNRMMLPLGNFPKSEVRRLASQYGLPVHDKPDSQEICFVPDNNYMRLLEKRTPEAVRPGSIVDANGMVVGTHSGHQNFTLGQRKGVGVAFGYPIYVTSIDPEHNIIHVGPREHLLHRRLIASQINWLTTRPVGPIPCTAKVRYNSPPVAAVAEITGTDQLTVSFSDGVTAITPGQAVVCYDGEQLLGGGWIDDVSEPVECADAAAIVS
ncbi:MAG TPA: tRNA 2-thiouridine(34) synthase MnmA [Phycisphaerae bacterium]|nr:tRNA 2-thiouridine(34) synthase MnmA [Phycisphaerae bacterium]